VTQIQNAQKPKKVVLAYSGGLDTSIIIPWLRETYGCEVIAMIGDVGQQEDLEAARKKALATGASSAVVEDLREEFIREYIWPTLRAGAVYEHTYLLGTSMARPVIAKRQAELALKLGADGLSHGCTGKGNDQVRFELAYKAIAPHVQIIAPWREWDIDSREDALAYAAKHNIPVEQSRANIYSRDRNIWHLSHEGAELEDPANAPNEAMWQWIVSPEKAPDKAEEVEIGFESGIPVSVNGKKLGPVELLNTLNDIAAKHGIGRTDLVENRLVGMKSRGAYETPGGTLLVTAHRELERLTLRFVVCSSSPRARWLFRRGTAKRHRFRRPETLERHAQRHQAPVALLFVSRRPRQLHHGPLQSQRRRRLHQPVRTTGYRATESQSGRQLKRPFWK
jgi:argininosuccinate synthase